MSLSTKLCECGCGGFTVYSKSRVNRFLVGHRARVNNPNQKHGEARVGHQTPEYRAYQEAQKRCNNPNSTGYKHWGGRGIEFRFPSFEAFLSEVGRKPSPKHSLDRLNVNGHYEPGNLRWATLSEQRRNTNKTKWLTVNGVTKALSDWAELVGVLDNTIHHRVNTYGWSHEDAVFTPVIPRNRKKAA